MPWLPKVTTPVQSGCYTHVVLNATRGQIDRGELLVRPGALLDLHKLGRRRADRHDGLAEPSPRNIANVVQRDRVDLIGELGAVIVAESVQLIEGRDGGLLRRGLVVH